MASAAAVQYPQPAGRLTPTLLSGNSSYSTHPDSFSSPLFSQSISHGRSDKSTRDDLPDARQFDPGALAAAKSMADSSKPHLRSSIVSSRTTTSHANGTDQTYHRAPFTSVQQQKSLAKVRFKSNFRKVTQRRNEGTGPTLDLSQTAEENEKRSGLGLYPSEPLSPSFSQVPLPSAATNFGTHSRSISHNSQHSSVSGGFKPSAPFTIPAMPSPRPRSPPVTSAYSASMINGAEPFSEGLSGLSQEVTFDAAPHDSTILERKPSPRLNTTASDSSTRLNYSPSSASASHNLGASPSLRSQLPITRPRRSTNQSIETAATSKSFSSIDRAFSFVTRSASGGGRDRSDLMDPLTRAATIQAARQAFQEREEAKDRKYELKEQKAAEKARRKRETNMPTTFGDGRRRRAANDMHSVKGASRVTTRNDLSISDEKPAGTVQATATEYNNMRAGPSPSRIDKGLQGSSIEKRKKKTMRGNTVKSRYARFLSWLKLKILNLGGRRRR